jgi:hypothetical protein
MAGLTEPLFLDLISARLVIERIGETDNLAWWESRVLSQTGKARIDEITPKTHFEAQIRLASKVGRKAESDRMPRDTISLFDFGPRIESRILSEIEELEADSSNPLQKLETLSMNTLESGWTDSIVDRIGGEPSISQTPDLQGDDIDSVRLAEEGHTQSELDVNAGATLADILKSYGQCTEELRPPYMPLVPDIESESV